MTADVALAKLAAIDRCLGRIREVTASGPETLDDLGTEEIVTLNLQRATQAAIDLAAHLISGRSWGLPESLRQHFRILGERGVIDGELSRRMEAMAGFRNIAVHDYERIDPSILKSIVRDRLGDLESYARAVQKFLGI